MTTCLVLTRCYYICVDTRAKVTAGAMVLGHSLRDNGTGKQLAALVTLDTLQTTSIHELTVINPAIYISCSC